MYKDNDQLYFFAFVIALDRYRIVRFILYIFCDNNKIQSN